MAASLRNISLNGVTIGSAEPPPLPFLFFEDTFVGSAGPLTAHAPTTGYPIPAAYGFGPWVDLTGDPQLTGSGTVELEQGDNASITSTGAVTYAANAGGYVITCSCTTGTGDDTLLELEGVLPNGIQYLIEIVFAGYATNPNTVTVTYGPASEYSIMTGIVDVTTGISVFLGNTAQSIEVDGVEEADGARALTFGSSNAASLSLYAAFGDSPPNSVVINNIQIDTL